MCKHTKRRASLEITPSCFAEFLKLLSLALLGLLDLTTCVGYRYDLIRISLRSFSRMMKSPKTLFQKDQSPITPQINARADLPTRTALVLSDDIHCHHWVIRHRPSPGQVIRTKDRNINL